MCLYVVYVCMSRYGICGLFVVKSLLAIVKLGLNHVRSVVNVLLVFCVRLVVSCRVTWPSSFSHNSESASSKIHNNSNN